jgi:hypothetical protein
MKQFPTTAIQLGNHIGLGCSKPPKYRASRWCCGFVVDGIWRLWLDGTDPRNASVSYEHRTLWVNLDRGDYYFELDRLHENHPDWSWRQQIAGKTWASAADFALLDALVELFPAAHYAPQPVQGALS